MSSIGSGYDYSSAQFSPGGKVFQIDYACKAVENSGTAIAMRGKDSIVFAVENIIQSPLHSKGSIKKLFNIDTHIGMSLAERIGMYIHAHTLYSAIRPFGISLLLGSVEDDGPHLYVIDPSGNYSAYQGCAIGKARQNAITEIEKQKLSELSGEALINEAAKIIYMVHDEIKDKRFELDMSWIGPTTKGIHQRVPEDLFQAAELAAKQALEADDLDDDAE